MPRSLPWILFTLLVCSSSLEGQAGSTNDVQVLDHTMVPRGRLRLQAHPVFTSWDSRFGRAADGTSRVESLGDDLTDPTALSLFPGLSTLTRSVEDLTAIPFDPALGASAASVQQDVTRIDFGGHVGVFDWLTVGVVVPWARTRSAIDVAFAPDSTNANLGLNPAFTSSAQVDAFLGSIDAADAAAQAYAAAECSSGPSAACTSAQALAGRTTLFDAALRAAYGASPFFPLSGTAIGDALAQSITDLSSDLSAAGLTVLDPLVLSSDLLLEESDLSLLPAIAGSGIEMAPLETRQSLWSAGDVELSARVRVLDNLTPRDSAWTHPGVGYRLTVSGLVRLPTGTVADPDVPYDLGTGQAQTDMQAGVTATLAFGERLSLTAGGVYGVQGESTIVRRVAPHEVVLAPVASRAQVVWRPGSYVGLGIAPSIHLAPSITLSGEYRLVHKRRDEFALVSAVPGLDPVVLALESGVKAHQVGGGLRYSTVERWRRGDASVPLEAHIRLLATIDGSGGQVPKATRVEAGIRLFRRLWGAP